MRSGISKWSYRHSSQDVCPWNVRFATALPDESPYAPRAALGGKDARRLARELLGMTQAEFSAAFKGSPMKRAKLPAMRRSAAVVFGDVARCATSACSRALDDPEPLVREHAAWALRRLGRDRDSSPPLTDADGSEP